MFFWILKGSFFNLDIKIRIKIWDCFLELTTEAHTTTRRVISIFFRKNGIRYAFGCFQNIVFYGFKYLFKLY
ncbi:hypothetical protein DMB68_02940 [Flavobacterium hydrophilum]|uniref:Uncharacterized protein n=1 Tax=Flavobacterium hydrophilum TaxID=2211445 RepID=A0A2V4C4A2_9FLAO|nr:hypothetical protein DMB68_02940 [Flavobacterium hydrophilum]